MDGESAVPHSGTGLVGSALGVESGVEFLLVDDKSLVPADGDPVLAVVRFHRKNQFLAFHGD